MKRGFDIIFSLSVLFFLSPFLLFISFLIFLFQGKSILFFQKRLGKNHKEFKIIKFCTMNNLKDAKGNILPDNKRTSKFGYFLRSTSIDELPSFINVLLGDMSVVGPRPLLTSYKDRYTKVQDRRHEIKPGVTGWAQINGRNNIKWKKKFLLDVWYVDNQSFLLDLKIILFTLYLVIIGKNILPKNKNQMDEFLGKK